MLPSAGRGPVPAVPTLPEGTSVASFRTYLEAQKAVDHLSDEAFPVRSLTIVGDDLRMVERVTGRLTYGRVAMGGLLSGAWFGLFIGLLLSMFSADGSGIPLVAAILMGAAFTAMFSLISYALSRGKRDFTSQSQIVATRYTVLCEVEHAGRARQMLQAAGIRSTAGTSTLGATPDVVPGFPPPAYTPPPPPAAPTGLAGGDAPVAADGSTPPVARPRPSSISSQYVTPDGRPRYGLRHEDLQADGTPKPEATAPAPAEPAQSGPPATAGVPAAPDASGPPAPDASGPAASDGAAPSSPEAAPDPYRRPAPPSR